MASERALLIGLASMFAFPLGLAPPGAAAAPSLPMATATTYSYYGSDNAPSAVEATSERGPPAAAYEYAASPNGVDRLDRWRRPGG